MKEITAKTTLPELINFINASSGMIATDIETVCIYQDIIGHTSVGDLTDISNGPHRETFYRVYDIACGTLETLKFYVANSNKICDMVARNDELENDFEYLNNELKAARENLKSMTIDRNELSNKLIESENKTAALEHEIKELKVKLYDLMTK